MDPTTGGIKALASWPTFDPSWFVQGLSKKHVAMVYGDNSGAPMLNRATQLSYAPGSTFKPFIALAAEQHGLASFSNYYPCPPEYVYPGDTTTVFHNWTTANLGTISVEQALKVSCDTVFYQFGADFYDRYNADRLGKDATLLQDSLRQFGFGAATKLDLPLETTGLIPDPTWKAQFAEDHPEVLLPDEQSWLPGDDIQMAIGQGFVTITPMQLAVAYSAIANGGKICRPHVVDHIEDPDGNDASGHRALQQADAPVHAGGARLHPQRPGDRDAVRRNGVHGVRRVPAVRGSGRRQDRHGTTAAVPGHVVVRGHGARVRPAVRDHRDGRTGRSRVDVGGADRPTGDRGPVRHR